MDDLKERLRRRRVPVMASAGLYEYKVNDRPDSLCTEAATYIEALEQRVSELEEALQEAVSYQQEAASYHDGPTYAWILRAKQVLAKALNREPNP
jgi:hypothetical protein